MLYLLLAALGAHAQVTAVGPNGPTNPSAPGFAAVGSTVNQNSEARLLTVNAIDDFCLYAPKDPGSTIGDVEHNVVAWCTKPRNNARLIPDGTIKSAQFLRAPSYVQVSGWWDGTRLNIANGDNGGELDPHGATGEGNPVGGNVTTNVAAGKDVFYEEWMAFVSYDQFCVRVCTANAPYTAAKQCDHIYDLQGCQWVMAIDNYWGMQGFESCDSDNAAPPGVYNNGASTWYQGQNPTPAAPAYLPKRSNCKSYPTISNGININNPKVTAPVTLLGGGGTPPVEPTQPPVNPGSATQLHPKGNSGWCADVRGAVFANGTPVQAYQCNGTPAQNFQLVRNAAGQVKVAGTNFCLDAGENPGNGSKLKLWQCYPGLKQQTWWYTGDNHLAIANGPGLCVDLTDGNLSNGNQLQVWACDGPNQNQIWTSGIAGGQRRRNVNRE